MNDTEIRHLAAIVRDADDAIISMTLDGIITSWNGGAARMYGYNAAEAIGQPMTLIIPPGREDELPTILRKLSEGARVDRFDTLRLSRDGRVVRIPLTLSPIRDQAGAIIGASGIAADMTRRLPADEERRLHESEERFRALFEHSPDGILLLDPHASALHWQIVDCNTAVLRMSGYSRDELIDHPLKHLIATLPPPEELDAVLGAIPFK